MTADRLPGEMVDANSGDEEEESARLLAEVQEAFNGSRGEEDLRKALETIQVRHRGEGGLLVLSLFLLDFCIHNSI